MTNIGHMFKSFNSIMIRLIKDKAMVNIPFKKTDKNKVSFHWSRKALQKDFKQRKYIDWMNHPYIEKHYINRQISNNPDENWLIYVNNKYISRNLDLGLTLGCGDGGLERHAIGLGMCKRFEAFDIAEGAIEIARKLAVQHGVGSHVKYEVADINKIKLNENKYDVAFASMSAHHFSELEHVYGQVRRALKPEGLFFLCEYIGPSQFQWTDQQLEIMNDLLEILPVTYRKLIPFPLKTKKNIRRPTIDEMNSIDPSEAIRSAEILDLLAHYFKVIHKIDFGGTILHPMLHNVTGNFDPDNKQDMTILKLICYFEEILIKKKVISSDFALIIAQNV